MIDPEDRERWIGIQSTYYSEKVAQGAHLKIVKNIFIFFQLMCNRNQSSLHRDAMQSIKSLLFLLLNHDKYVFYVNLFFLLHIFLIFSQRIMNKVTSGLDKITKYSNKYYMHAYQLFFFRSHLQHANNVELQPKNKLFIIILHQSKFSLKKIYKITWPVKTFYLIHDFFS